MSIRGEDLYRCRPEQELAFRGHAAGEQDAQPLGGDPSNASPILAGEHAVFGRLDGSLQVVPLSGAKQSWPFKTGFGRPITAPAAVCDGRVYFGCDNGYLDVLGPNLDLIDVACGNQLVATRPAIETIKCVGSIASNGRIFYTANGTGIQCCGV